MYVSNSHPGINTSPQPPIQEIHPKSKKYSEKIPKLHYDGDESDAEDNEEFGDAELYHRHQAFSLPDLLVSSSISTSTYSLHQEELYAEGNALMGVEPSVPGTTPQKKKRRKRKSESEIESPSKLGGVGSSHLTITKSRGSKSPTFLASTPILHQLQSQLLEIPLLRAHWDLGNSIGRRRGVCGSNRVSLNNPVSSSSLDVALFTFFYYSDQFDEWILDDKIGKAYPTLASKEVRTLLRKEILYSLRNAYYCPSASVGRLSKVLFAAQSQPQQFEISRFFSYFLEKVLTLPETTHYTNGSSKLIHILQSPTPGQNHVPLSVQQLFQQSLGDLKLLSVPYPGLFLAVKDPLVVPHPMILPNLQLDLSRTLIQLSDDNDTEDGFAELFKAQKGATPKNWDKTEDPQFCKCFRSLCKVVYTYLENLVEHLPTYGVENCSNFNQSLITVDDSNDDAWSVTATSDRANGQFPINGGDDLEKSLKIKTKKPKGKLNLALDLMAVICLEQRETYGYSAFVRCGQNPRRGWAPWVHFTPCDQGAPVVTRVEDLGIWLHRLEKRPEKMKTRLNAMPPDIHNILSNSTFFIYTPKPDYESQNTLFSYVNEC